MYPKQYEREEDMPAQAQALIRRLMPLLLDGPHPALAALRQQYASARLVHLDWTGVGFFASFDVSDEVPAVDPARISGGHADIEVEGVEHGAGCVLHIADGRLGCLEVFSYSEPWPEDATVLAVRNAVPILPQPTLPLRPMSLNRPTVVSVPTSTRTSAQWVWTAVFVGLVLGMTALALELL